MNVKPGDLAIVVKSRNGQNLGKIIEVLEWAPKGIESEMLGQQFFTDLDGWRCKGDIFLHGKIYPFGVFCDDGLRPVSGLPDTEHTNEREPIKELA